MFNEELKPIKACYVCHMPSQKDSNFCSLECLDFYLDEMSSFAMREHLIQKVIRPIRFGN